LSALPSLALESTTFKVNGKTHERTTNNAGIASITLNLPVGQYGISYSFKKILFRLSNI